MKSSYMNCNLCGQRFYLGDLNQVGYHEQIPHKPMKAILDKDGKKFKSKESK